ncbi:MAG: DUF1559 domain-containing protein [Planctomycetota bacterium]
MSENPYESPETPGRKSEATGTAVVGATALGCLGVPVVLAVLAALSLPVFRGAPEAARRTTCSSHMKQIGYALHSYEADHGAFPPAYTVDADGNRLHSWRTLLLPYLEEQALYDIIDLTRPWDDPANAAARAVSLEFFQCPSVTLEEGHTNYLGVTGPGCFFDGATERTFADITDGTGTTVMLVDAPAKHAVHWMSPQDISAEEVAAIGPDTPPPHPGGFNAAFADGHCGFINTDTDRSILRALLTIAGGETLP